MMHRSATLRGRVTVQHPRDNRKDITLPTWTFTTTDPETATRLSLFCAGLGHVTETRTNTAAPAKAPARRKPAPVDCGCWRDPEARKVRAKALAWGRKPVQGNLPTVARTHDPVRDYAEAMGWSRDKAVAKNKAHQAHLEANSTEYRW